MNNTREWIPWVAVITCAIGKYISEIRIYDSARI